MSLSEFDLIATYFQRQPKHKSVVKGVGDDCAIVSARSDHHLVMSMDTLVLGRHFPQAASPEQIATRAFCTCLSDLAAMAAEPRWFTLALTLPEADPLWLERFSRALLSIADDYACELVGGDTTQGPLTLTLQVHGEVKQNCALTRDAAKEGDAVFVSGYLGDGAAALDILLDESSINLQAQAGVDKKELDYLSGRFYCPEPQIKLAQAIADYSHAAIDISDGLVADLQHIAVASQVDIDIDVDALPISSACQKVAGDRALQYALSGGDDYQLAFTVPAQHIALIEQINADEKWNMTLIGKVVALNAGEPDAGKPNPGKAVVRCFQNKQLFTVKDRTGYQHFAS